MVKQRNSSGHCQYASYNKWYGVASLLLILLILGILLSMKRENLKFYGCRCKALLSGSMLKSDSAGGWLMPCLYDDGSKALKITHSFLPTKAYDNRPKCFTY